MMKPIVLIATLCAVAVSGCTDRENRIPYDGQYFRTKVDAVDKSRDTFLVTVKDPSKSTLGARLSAHHEGTQYCVRNFGSSAIIWDNDPLNEEAPLRIVDNKLTYQGTCPQAQRI